MSCLLLARRARPLASSLDYPEACSPVRTTSECCLLTFNCSRFSSDDQRRGSSSASGDDRGRSAGCAHHPTRALLPALNSFGLCCCVRPGLMFLEAQRASFTRRTPYELTCACSSAWWTARRTLLDLSSLHCRSFHHLSLHRSARSIVGRSLQTSVALSLSMPPLAMAALAMPPRARLPLALPPRALPPRDRSTCTVALAPVRRYLTSAYTRGLHFPPSAGTSRLRIREVCTCPRLPVPHVCTCLNPRECIMKRCACEWAAVTNVNTTCKSHCSKLKQYFCSLSLLMSLLMLLLLKHVTQPVTRVTVGVTTLLYQTRVTHGVTQRVTFL